MTKKTTTATSGRTSLAPDAINNAHALREAGYTTLAISQRTGISVRTLKRHFTAAGTRKGAMKAAAINKAKEDLLAHITSDEKVKYLAAKLLADDLAHSIHLREVILAATEHMVATCLADAVQVTRAAAAYSTTIKNTSDLIRHSLRGEALTDPGDELPELTIRELSQADIERLRQHHAEEDEAKEKGVELEMMA